MVASYSTGSSSRFDGPMEFGGSNQADNAMASESVSAPESPRALSVSAAMALAKDALEGVVVRILGEVSEVNSKPGYKAVYFTIKDTGASLPCMMWNNRYQSAGVKLTVGALVELTGRFTLYAAKGRMNFDVFSLALAGEGNLRLQVANLARKLQAEGLMEQGRKRPLPTFPLRIGVVTSPRGAAIHDVLRTLRRRYPLAEVLVAGVPVEGVDAPKGIIAGLRRLIEGGAEVVLVVRGGGSFEDLMPFNDEALARAIAASPVPVVTGIGHEPDTSIADMVADLRASTPTAAAEAVAPAIDTLETQVQSLGKAMENSLRMRLERSRLVVDRIAALPLFREPMRLFEEDAQTLDDLALRLNRSIPESLEKNVLALDRLNLRLTQAGSHLVAPRAQALEGLHLRLIQAGPRLTASRAQTLETYRGRLHYQGPALVKRFRTEVGMAAARLNDLSPLQVLSRGYAIAKTSSGHVIKRVSQVHKGRKMEVTVSNGIIACTVDSTRKTDPGEAEKK